MRPAAIWSYFSPSRFISCWVICINRTRPENLSFIVKAATPRGELTDSMASGREDAPAIAQTKT
jgi:hypothetical protein